MKTMIYCREKQRGEHNFFLTTGKETYYLFSQKYRKGVNRYFAKGVTINESMAFAKGRYDKAIMNTMTKLPLYIRYIEKEYGIEVYEKTRKKRLQANDFSRCA